MNLHDVADLDREEWERLIVSHIFNERDRAILRRRLFDGIPIERLAEEFDISVSQTKRILNKSQDKLFRKLNRK